MTYRTLASRPKLAGIWKFGGCTQAWALEVRSKTPPAGAEGAVEWTIQDLNL